MDNSEDPVSTIKENQTSTPTSTNRHMSMKSIDITHTIEPFGWAVPLFSSTFQQNPLVMADIPKPKAKSSPLIPLPQTSAEYVCTTDTDEHKSIKFSTLPRNISFPSSGRFCRTGHNSTQPITKVDLEIRNDQSHLYSVPQMPVALLVYPSEENPHKAKDRLPRCYLVIGDQPERQSPSMFERPNLTTSSTWPDQKFYETRSDAKAMDYFSSQVDRCGTEANNLPIACSHMTAASSQGLACLRNLSKIFIHQQIQLLEVFSNWEATNRYIVKNSRGQRLLYATEESDICTRQCCGHQRSFVIRMLDEHNFEVARATRQFSCAVSLTSCHLCCCCFCWGFCAEQKAIGNSSAASTTGISSLAATCRRALCWLVHRCDCSERFMQSLLVESPPGQVIGRVQEEPHCPEPRWSVIDSENCTVLQITGPSYCCKLPCLVTSNEFRIMSADGTTLLGYIIKEWTGFVREVFTDADDFSLHFPEDLDVRVKTLLIGAVFLLDFTFFENNRGQPA